MIDPMLMIRQALLDLARAVVEAIRSLIATLFSERTPSNVID